MSDIPGISERAPQRPVYVNQVADMAKALGLTEDAQVMAKEIAGLLASQPNVRVQNSASPTLAGEVGSAKGPTGAPALDSPDDAKQKEVNLEKLISYLQLETDKRQTELAKDRIELQKNELEQRHGEQMAKINESLEQMDKATISNNFTRVFGWLMAAAAVALAVVSCVATGGIAVGAVIGAVMAVGMCVMNETGVTEDLTEALTDALKNAGMSDQAAQIVASLTVAVGMIALTLGTGAGGSAIQTALGGAAKAATSVMLSAQSMQGGMRLALGGIGIGTTVAMGVSTSANYKSTELQADTTEMEKFMAVMQQQLEESQEELERILSQIQDLYTDVAAIINSSIDTENEIVTKMGQMA
jgi:nitrate reductase assembly molybdenum cofactor insertion protein NarJ